MSQGPNAERRYGCDHDITFDVANIADLRKSQPTLLMTTAIEAGAKRKTHEMLADGTHVLDQGNKLRTILPTGDYRSTALDAASVIVGITEVGEAHQNSVCVVLEHTSSSSTSEAGAAGAADSCTSSAALFDIDAEGTGTKTFEQAAPAGLQIARAVGHLPPAAAAAAAAADAAAPASPPPAAAAHLALLLSNGDLYRVVVPSSTSTSNGGDAAAAPASTSASPRSWEEAEAAGHLERVSTDVSYFSLSCDGTAYAVLGRSGLVTVVHAGTLVRMCELAPSDEEIASVRIVSGLRDGAVAKSLNLVVFSSKDDHCRATLFHVKQGATGTWQAWRVQAVFLKGIGAQPFLEVSASGDVLCVADRTRLFVLRLSVATEAGRMVRSLACFDCGDGFGGFVSVTARTVKGKGVRVSAQREGALVLHDLSFVDLAEPKERDQQQKSVDEANARVRKLTEENKQLKLENAALTAQRSSDLPHDFELQLKATIRSVEETCVGMARFQSEVASRLQLLEESVKANEAAQNEYTAEVQRQFKKASEQAISVIADSSQKSHAEMREIQIVTASQLKKTGEAVEEGLRRVVVESNKSREAEVGRLFTGLKDVVEGMLSEPGLMRLRDVVSQTVCPSAQGETEAEAMKQVLHDALDKELKLHLEKTAQVLLKSERETLLKHLTDVLAKSEGLLSNVGVEAAREVKLGIEQVLKVTEGSDPEAFALWQEQATKELNQLLTTGKDILGRISAEPVDASVERLVRRRDLSRLLDTPEFWRAGVAAIAGAGTTEARRELVTLLCTTSTTPPTLPFGVSPESLRAFKQTLVDSLPTLNDTQKEVAMAYARACN